MVNEGRVVSSGILWGLLSTRWKEIPYKHLMACLDANANLIPPTSDVFACWEVWFPQGDCRFSGGGCEWCLLPGFRHNDSYSFTKYSQIQNSDMKSRISKAFSVKSLLAKAFSMILLTKSSSFNEVMEK